MAGNCEVYGPESSQDQEVGLRSRESWVQIGPGPPFDPEQHCLREAIKRMKDQFKVKLKALSGQSQEAERFLKIELQGKLTRRGTSLFVEGGKLKDVKLKLEKFLYHRGRLPQPGSRLPTITSAPARLQVLADVIGLRVSPSTENG